MDLVDRKTGKTVQIDDTAEAAKAYRSGQYGIASDTVNVTNKDGTLGTIPTDQLDSALKGGYELVSDKDAHDQRIQEKYGGIGGRAAAFGINAGDAITLGAGKGIAAAIGGDDAKEYMRGVEEANPLSATAGTVAGVVAPMLVGDEAGALGLLAKPAEALEGLGGLAEKGVGSLLGEAGTGLASRVGRSALTTGVRSGLEGSVYGGLSQWSESQVDDTPLTSEKMLAAMGKNALLGLGLGAGLGAGGTLLGEGVTRGLSKLADKTGGEGGLQEYLEKTANERAFKATKATPTQVARLERGGQTQEALGEYMMAKLPEYSEKPFWRMTRQDISDAATKARQAEGSTIGEAVDKIHEIAQSKGVTTDAMKIADRLETEVLAPLRADPFTQGIAKKIEAHSDALFEKAGVLARDESGKLVPTGSNGSATFKELHDWSKTLGDIAYNEQKTDSLFATKMRDMNRIMRDEFKAQAAKVAPEELAKLEAANAGFAKAKSVENAIAPAVKRGVGNRTVGLTDYLGAGIGFMHGGALGAAVGAVGNKVAREFGDQAIASALSHASNMSMVRELTGAFDQRLSAGIAKALNKGSGRIASDMVQIKTSRDTRKSEARINAIKDLAAAPSRVVDLSARLGPPASSLPKASASFAGIQSNALAYLAKQAPQGRPLSPLMPTLRGEPSKPEIQAYNAKLEVYEDPTIVFDEMAKGTLSRDHVEALKALYPQIYQEMQTKTMEQLAELGAKDKLPPFERRLQLGLLFGIPADATQDPTFVKTQQSMYAASGNGPDQGPGAGADGPGKPPGQKPMKLTQQLSTESQRLEDEDQK